MKIRLGINGLGNLDLEVVFVDYFIFILLLFRKLGTW